MQNIKKYFMTLALLLTAVGGAWADETLLLTIESKDYTTFTSGSKTFDDKVTVTFSNDVYNEGNTDGWLSITESLLTVAGTNGYTITSCKFYTEYGTASTGYTVEGESPSVYLSAGLVFTDANESVYLGDPGINKIEVYGTAAEITEWSLTPDADKKVWTLAKMPASNIELQVEYYAESNLFLGKEALADKTNITVKNGETDVAFDDKGKSTNTVTEGNTVTAKFTGKKVLGMKVEKKAAAPSLTLTSPEVGQVICSDGKNYAYGSLPTGVTAVAKICYVSGSNGLALALTDEEDKMNWSTAIETCAAHTPAFTGGTWKLASKDEWSNMISAAGSYSALRDGFSSVGGTNMQEDTYWSSTERDSDDSQAWVYFFNFIGNWSFGNKEANAGYVRPCLAF